MVAHGEEPAEAKMAGEAVKLSPAAGRVTETIVRALLSDGPGGNNNSKTIGDLDVVVVQFFDGEHWQVGQYHNFRGLYDDGSHVTVVEPTEVDVSGNQGFWLFTLLHFLYSHVMHPDPFMWSRFESYVKALTPSEAVAPNKTPQISNPAPARKSLGD
jgi:hypothetical protein